MKVITTRQIRNETKTYFELAEKERILVKRGDKFINLIVTDDPDHIFFDENWLKDFFNIPEEYRCNPFDISPSGDLYWADKRNIKAAKDVIESNALTMTIKSKEELSNFLDSL